MVLVLLFVMFVVFLVAPATLIFGATLGVPALVAKQRGGNPRVYFGPTNLKVLGVGVAATLLALLMVGACGRDVVVK